MCFTALAQWESDKLSSWASNSILWNNKTRQPSHVPMTTSDIHAVQSGRFHVEITLQGACLNAFKCVVQAMLFLSLSREEATSINKQHGVMQVGFHTAATYHVVPCSMSLEWLNTNQHVMNCSNLQTHSTRHRRTNM